jgi:hypothetical protein
LHNKFWMRKNIYYVGLQQEKWFWINIFI